MESPKAWAGYTEDWDYVTTVYAKDANNYINPAEVSTQINNVTAVMDEQIGIIQKALSSIIEDANQAIVVNNIKLGQTIQDLVDNLEMLKGNPNESLEYLYTGAVQAHDNIQSQLNDNAYYYTFEIENVVHVR